APIPVFNGKRFDIFQTSQACHLMVEYGDRMESDTLALCEAVVDEGCSEGIGMTAPVQTSARCSGHVT
ncbi:MAG: hypothetical protein K9N51_12070, partial [Candidatus Pacebacteria bacterium]|nr:hypothetical protein [Candidatus Paceibacterota bacterium]